MLHDHLGVRMGTIKRIVCLANSRKLSGRCVAGIEIDGNGNRIRWIRPVSNPVGGELSYNQYRYRDGTELRVLDIVDVSLLRPCPHRYQRENWLIDDDGNCKKVGRISWYDLHHLVDPPEPLWIDGYHSRNCANDKIPLFYADTLSSSLRLLYLDRLSLCTVTQIQPDGSSRRRLQGRFSYGSRDYRLWITDPIVERRYLGQLDGCLELRKCFVTLSLSEPFEGHCYKLIAAIIPAEGGLSV